jgi:DNA segregation ATPase FtsK/SpoIIIE, S-DNA-T family
MICAQCKSEFVDSNQICPNCGAEFVMDDKDPTRLVQNICGGVSLSSEEQINIRGDTVGHDKIEVKNDYSVTNTIYQFNLISDGDEQLARDYHREEDHDSIPEISTPNIRSQVKTQQQGLTAPPKSISLKITSPILSSTDQIWRLPPANAIFGPPDRISYTLDEMELSENIELIQMILSNNDAPAKVVAVQTGPTVTQYGLEPGYRKELEVIDIIQNITQVRWRRTQVNEIKEVQTQIAMILNAPVRFIGSGLGKSYVSIEVPNPHNDIVYLRNVIQAKNYSQACGQLRIGVGESSTNGTAIVGCLEDMHHLCIIGVPGSGKSTCIQTILTSLLMKNTPHDLRLVLIDPKGTQFHEYCSLPHLLLPVITNKYMAVEVLEKMLVEMETRYDIFTKTNVRSVFEYDSIIAKDNKCLPSLVIVIEDLPNLIEVDPESVQQMLVELTEKGHNVEFI